MAEAEAVFTAVLSDPEVQRIGALIDEEEHGAGAELEGEFQVFQDRYARAVRTGTWPRSPWSARGGTGGSAC